MTGGNYQMIILISFHPSTFADVFNKLKIKSYEPKIRKQSQWQSQLQ